jgi:replication fork protection complex subunit Tof1/Swi1
LFKTILADQKSFPKEQPYKDLVALISYVLRQFFKAVEADSFVLVEVRPPLLCHVIIILTKDRGFPSELSMCAQAFFPKNRNRWKRYSSWEPENKTKKTKDVDTGHPPDVQVKKGFSWSEQLAIAMAALQDAGQSELIEWVKEVCLSVCPSVQSGQAPERMLTN